LLYTSAAVIDQFDGYLARRSDHATRLGQALDLELDGLGVLLAVAVAIHYGQLPLVFLAVGLARYVFLLWGAALRWSGVTPHPIPESMTRRSIAGLQMGFLCGALWPIAPPELLSLAGSMFAVPFAFSFGRDMLVMAGWLNPASLPYLRLRSMVRRIATRLAPSILRPALVLFLGYHLRTRLGDLPAAVAEFAAKGVELPQVAVVLVLLQALCLVCVAVGFLGRVGALLLTVATGLWMVAVGPSPVELTIIGLAVGVLILGTGPSSAWAPEAKWLGRWGKVPR
jgi:CDP-diacylglycerol--glycerol-3-phosphate 3-phosphatidyltransferase